VVCSKYVKRQEPTMKRSTIKRSTHTIAAGLAGLTLLVAGCGDDGTSQNAVAVSTETPATGTGLPTNGLPASAQGAERWVGADAPAAVFTRSADANERWAGAEAQPAAFSSSADASERWVTAATDGCETQGTPDAIEHCVLGS
jgi:hypothetical protein